MRSIYAKEPAEPVDHFRLQYSIKSAARMLDASERTVEDWIKRFEVPNHTIGGQGKRYIRHDDLVTFIEQHRVIQSMTSRLYGDSEQV